MGHWLKSIMSYQYQSTFYTYVVLPCTSKVNWWGFNCRYSEGYQLELYLHILSFLLQTNRLRQQSWSAAEATLQQW